MAGKFPIPALTAVLRYRPAMLLVIGFLAVSCNENYPPRIIKTEFARLPGIGITTFNLRVEAADPDMDEITYLWEAREGEFINGSAKSEVTWTAPVALADKEYKVVVTVSDGKEQVSDTLSIPVIAVTYGDLTGFAYFTGCRFPVPGAVISIDGKQAESDQDGSFRINQIRAGRQTLTAEKTGFTRGTVDVLITSGPNNSDISLTSTLYTGKLNGQISGNLSGEFKPFHTVIILNPDNSESELRALSNSSGFYQITGIPFGFMRLIVRDEVRVRMETLVYIDSGERLFNIFLPEPFRFTDSRDNHEYKAVRIASQVWMAENLAYLPRVSPGYDGGGIWVYGYQGTNVDEARSTANFARFGCLYDWSTAVSDNHGNGRDICPPGWHLPDDADWKNLEKALGMDPAETDSVSWRFTGNVGRKIKADNSWDNDGNGTNSSSFEALPAGYRASFGAFLGLNGYAHFWTSNDLDTESAWRRYLYYNQDAIGRYTDFKTNGFSVRCMRD